jgi:hypothetical protein
MIMTTTHRNLIRRVLIPAAVLVLLAAACGDDDTTVSVGGTGGDTTTSTAPVGTATSGSPEERLKTARARWTENGLESYRLSTREVCFCPETIWVDVVVDGEVVSHNPAGDATVYDPGERTMESLFGVVEQAIEVGYAELNLELDPESGALISYWVDVDERSADEEHGVEVLSLEPYEEQSEIDAQLLTDDYGCGYGFAAGNRDQTLALIINPHGGSGDGADVTSAVVFPADDWTAEIVVGTDLFSNWCDDLIEPGEPTTVIEQRWPLVEGSLVVDANASGPGCDGTVVNGLLREAVAESPSGERIDLPSELTLENTAWGCLAG